MFVVTAKMSRRTVLAVLFGVLAVVVAVCVAIASRSSTPTYNGDEAMADAAAVRPEAGETDSERCAFLAYFGWSCEAEPREAYAVTIPKKFDRVYENYNEIQCRQGYDLKKYRGKKVMKYAYRITNYEGYTGEVYANLLVYKNKIIGGDICAASLDGFMHGFERPQTGADGAA